MSGKRSNFGQAMFEMFGLGRDLSAQPAGEPEFRSFQDDLLDFRGLSKPGEPGEEPPDFPEELTVPVHTRKGTYLAAGTTIQGTLTAGGDVEIAGGFEGEIIAKGKVTLRSSVTSKITAAGLTLAGGALIGDSEISGDVFLDEQSTIAGNVKAGNLVCSGRIEGDLDIQENLVLNEFAQVDGSIKTGTISIARGAKIPEKIEMRNLEH